MLESLTLDSFAPLLAQSFTLDAGEGATLPLTLFEAAALPGNAFPGRQRDPFQIRFKGALEMLLEQRIYRLHHPALGALHLFLVPVGREPDGYVYQAVFS